MFRREENPVLFDAACRALRDNEAYKRGPQMGERLFTKLKKTGVIDNDLIIETETLVLTEMANGLQSLRGIENFVALRRLKIAGLRDDECVTRACKDGSKTLEDAMLISREYFMQHNQIMDLSALYSLTYLEELNLDNQQHIEEIDLSKFPELKKLSMQCCNSLTTVKGVDKLLPLRNAICDPASASGIRYDFSGSVFISEIDGLDKVLTKAINHASSTNRPMLHFPVESYIRLANQREMWRYLATYAGLMECAPNRDIFNWRENSTTQSPVGLTTCQTDLLKRRIDNILDTICDPEDAPLQNTYNIYEYITQFTKYDNEEIRQRETYLEKIPGIRGRVEFTMRDNTIYKQELLKNQQRIAGVSVLDALNDDEYKAVLRSHTARSAYVALFQQEAVCVGVSNLFNVMMCDMGYTAAPCLCWVKHQGDERVLGHATHQISVTQMYDEDGQINYYFFDPTWDLGKSEMRHFALNSQELAPNILLMPWIVREKGEMVSFQSEVPVLKEEGYTSRCIRAAEAAAREQQNKDLEQSDGDSQTIQTDEQMLDPAKRQHTDTATGAKTVTKDVATHKTQMER